jgi:hypothetical protein
MNMPGFTAEVSLYRSRERYQIVGTFEGRVEGVLLQLGIIWPPRNGDDWPIFSGCHLVCDSWGICSVHCHFTETI